jgi:hypothetical protein
MAEKPFPSTKYKISTGVEYYVGHGMGVGRKNIGM